MNPPVSRKSKRQELLDALAALLPAQLDEVLFYLEVPSHYLSAPPSPPLTRAVEAIRYLEQSGRLEDLEAIFPRRPGSRSGALSEDALEEPPASDGAVRCYLGHAPPDQWLADQLRAHLAGLVRSGRLWLFEHCDVSPTGPLAERTRLDLERADFLVALLGPDFLSSEGLFELATLAMERQGRGSIRVLPIGLRPCDLLSTPFAPLQALLFGGRFLTSLADRDAAWLEVVQAVRAVVNEAQASRGSLPMS